MSKFVTYPAVTVLDNDHSLLIDDPNAGTNSITAENAGNTLLSKWAGFETFDEAVQNTIEHNQEFIDRDAAIRSETAELKKKIVTTFPAKEASGAVATFESEFEDAPLKSCIVRVEPVQDLHGYDSPWPGGGGKNKFQTTAETRTVNGTTFTVNDDGTVTMVGTPTANINGGYSFGEVTLPTGNYKLNGNSNPNSDLRLTCYNVTASSVIASIYNNNDLSFTLSDESVIRLYPFVSTSFSGSAITMKPMIRIASESDATFAPYENICPITGWTGCAVQRTGKNLLKLDETKMVQRGWNEWFPLTIKSGTYTMSCQNRPFISGAERSIQVRLTDLNKTPIINISSGYAYGDGVKMSFSFSITEEQSRNVAGIVFEPVGGAIVFSSLDNMKNMLELGTTATPYEPYQGQTYPITFPTEAGTVYGGYIDPINGVLTVDRATIDITTGSDNGVRNSCQQLAFLAPGKAPGLNNFISNLFSIGNEAYQMTGRTGTTTVEFRVPLSAIGVTADDSSLTRMNAFRAWLDENHTQLVYELAEPIHYPLTALEIKTLLGTNNIWSNTGDTAVEYLMSDVSWYVEKKLRAFQSILAGVEDSSTASKNYSANTYLVFNDDIYKTTKAITAGETIEEGVNVTKTTVAEQLLALAQA